MMITESTLILRYIRIKSDSLGDVAGDAGHGRERDEVVEQGQMAVQVHGAGHLGYHHRSSDALSNSLAPSLYEYVFRGEDKGLLTMFNL